MQYRWLSFFIPELLIRSGMSVVMAYLSVRTLCLGLSFWLMARIGKRLTDSPLAPYLLVMALALYYAASTQAHIQPSEEPNLLVFALFIRMVLRNAGIVPLAGVFYWVF